MIYNNNKATENQLLCIKILCEQTRRMDLYPIKPITLIQASYLIKKLRKIRYGE